MIVPGARPPAAEAEAEAEAATHVEPHPAAAELARLRSHGSAKWSRYGSDVLPAWVADMDLDPPEPVKDAMRTLIDRGDLGYNFAAIDRLGEVWDDWLQRRHGVSLPTSQMRAFTGVLQAIEVTLEAVSEPGDKVILLAPIYHMFRESISGGGRRELLVPCGPAGELHADALDAAASDPAAKAILLSHPHNPLGRVYRVAEIEAIAEIAERHDLVVISDEIWADLVYAPQRHRVFVDAAPQAAERTVTLGSASKTFNLAGLSCAVAHFGPKAIRDSLDSRSDHVHGRPSSLSAEATVAAFTQCDDWHRDTLGLLAANRDRIAERLAAEAPGVGCLPPEATYLAWLDFRRTRLGDDPARVLLKRSGVALSPGHEFSPEASGFARLNFATPTPILNLILDRIIAAVNSQGGRA